MWMRALRPRLVVALLVIALALVLVLCTSP
jgi:hypothetical protein